MLQLFNHKHILVRAEVRRPPTTVDAMDAWLVETVEAVGMKILMGPHSIRCETEGNVGVTGAVVIETSHMTAHSWEEADVPFIQMDLYSCADFTSTTFVDTVCKHFDATEVKVMVVDRNCLKTRLPKWLSRLLCSFGASERGGMRVIEDYTVKF